MGTKESKTLVHATGQNAASIQNFNLLSVSYADTTDLGVESIWTDSTRSNGLASMLDKAYPELVERIAAVANAGTLAK